MNDDRPTRNEHDLLGEIRLFCDIPYGANTARALKNFAPTGLKHHEDFLKAFAAVKRAAALANKDAGVMDEKIADAISAICTEMEQGRHLEHIVVEPLSGGAGTSLNMNFNEVIANLANERFFNAPFGTYSPVHYLDSVNQNQSTNDTYPTAVRVAGLFMLARLEASLANLQAALQEKETEFADVLTVGRTEMQDAVCMTMGQIFSVWSEAIARDRWRIFKCTERIKVVNIGGGAVGTGLGAPKQYIFKVIEHLRRITGLPVSRADNTVEATANQDSLVEASGILSALAANILKICGDLRLLSFSPVNEITLPPLQAGSTAMPHKVNPVAAEYGSQAAIMCIGSHNIVTMAAGCGNLALSQFMPLLAWHFLQEIVLMDNAVRVLADSAIRGITVNRERCRANLDASAAFAYALVPHIGYENVQAALVHAARVQPAQGNISIRQALLEHGATEEMLQIALSPANLRKLGW